MKKILITGGAGFIGFVLSKMLSEDKNNEIFIIDNLSKGTKDDYFNEIIEKSNVTFYDMDMTNLDEYTKIEQLYDQIYHLAAIVGVKKVMKNPSLTLRTNVLSTIYLIDFIKNMKCTPDLLFASSCENYAGSIKLGIADIPTTEDIPLCIYDLFNPRWTYAYSKIFGEISFINYRKEYKSNVKIVRYHNIYGPRMGTRHVIPEFILKILNENNPFMIHGGNQYRTFCYITDAVKMTINIMDKSKEVLYNIGSDDKEILIKDVATSLFELSNFQPNIIDKGAPEGSVDRRKPDMSKLKSEFLYVNEISFEKGLKLTYDWYKNNIDHMN